MAIRNRDGSVYKLRGPNPHMRDQEFWDMTAVKLHNFGSRREEVVEPREVVEKIPVETEEIEEISEKSRDLEVQCLPAKLVRNHDTLYDEDRSTVEYGEKYVFPGTVTEETDLRVTLWTPGEPPGEGSILRLPGGRWWRVSAVVEAPEGFWVRGVPSDSQPNFS